MIKGTTQQEKEVSLLEQIYFNYKYDLCNPDDCKRLREKTSL